MCPVLPKNKVCRSGQAFDFTIRVDYMYLNVTKKLDFRNESDFPYVHEYDLGTLIDELIR